MRIHHRRFQFKVVLFGKRSYCLHFGESLKSVFAHKAWYAGVETLKRFASVPCAPVVAVGNLPAFGSAPIGFVGRTVHIETGAVQTLYHLRQQLTEQYVVSAFHFGKCLGCVFSLPSPVAHALVYLVVATPHGERRMSAQTLYVIFCLSLHAFDEQRVVRIGAAGEHEVLPYQYAVAVGLGVEIVVFVDAASPHAQHIHVGSLYVFKNTLVALGRDVGQQGVVGYEVSSLGKHRLAVHYEVERLAVFVVVHHHLD